MRYDIPIFFQKLVPGEYDPSIGDYTGDYYEETKRWANVTDSQTEFLKLQYGVLKEGSLIIRMQNHYSEPFDRVRIGTTIYRSVSIRDLRHKKTLILAEVGPVVEKESEVEPDG